jgi:hypothetical protein
MCATKFFLILFSHLKFLIKKQTLKTIHFGAQNESQITLSCTKKNDFIVYI